MSNKSRVLITGADGFIGSHLTEKLLKEGFEVKAFCMYNSNSSLGWLDSIDKSSLRGIDIILGDIRDPSCVFEAVKGCNQVFHLAALISIPYSYKAPSSYIDTNIHGTLNVVQAARDLEVDRVIHTSTSETYGTAQYVPIDENHPQVGQSPYAASKIGADQIALSFYRSFDVPVSVIRPFNTYGPRQSTRAVIPTIIAQIASRQKQLKLGSLTPTRDFNYVDDTCEAFLRIANCDAAIGKVVNACSNFEISIAETVKLISEVMDSDISLIIDQNRLRPENSEVNRLFGDNTLLKKLTGWSPAYSGIDGFRKGIRSTVDWFTNPTNLMKYRPQEYSL
tara:strand:+ start:968 stop:1975 length:1008 start_codon:yes stop_codon:yes gene_type:complete